MPRPRELFQYDAAEVNVIFDGLSLKGYIAGDFVSIEADADDTSKTKGATGDVVINYSNDRCARVTFRCHDGSSVNGDLSDKRKARTVGTFRMTDNNGSDLWSADKAWIVRAPNDRKGAEATENEWMIDLFEADISQGGLTPA